MAKKYHLDDKQIVALIHNYNLKDWDDGPQVNNIFFGTRLYLNETVPPISIYTTMFENNPNRVELSQIPTMDPNFKEEESSVLARFETTSPTWISEIVNLPKDVNFVVHAKVKRLLDNKGWFQQLCWKCEQKLVDTYNVELEKAILWCEKCAAEMQWVPRIRTTMTVRDTFGTCEMTLFDSQLSKLCNRSIIWLNSRAKSCADPYDVLAEVNGVLNQSFVWIEKKNDFNVSKNYRVYTVVDATDDLEVTKKITTKLSKKKGDPIDLDNDSDEYNTPRTFKVKNNVMHDGTLSTSGSSKHREKANSGKRKSVIRFC